jgi:hypothetical protein
MTYAAAPSAGGDFRIGSVLNRAFEICVANFPFFLIVTLVVALPNLLIQLNKPVADQSTGVGSFFILLAVSVLVGIVLNTVGEAVILLGAFQRLRGQPLDPAAALQRALTRFFPLLGLGFLYAIAIMIGFVLLVVPGVILIVMWAVVVPACLVEGLGPIASMSRSGALTKGHRWQILGIIILLGIVNWIGSFILGLVLSAAGPVITAIVNLVWTAAWAVYWNCVLIMIYHDLRIAKEGVDTTQIASIFD